MLIHFCESFSSGWVSSRRPGSFYSVPVDHVIPNRWLVSAVVYNEERIKVFSTVRYKKIDFPAIIKNLSYPVLHIELNDENNELEVSLSYVLAKGSWLRSQILIVSIDENLIVSDFRHGVVLLD